jgi:hypothetical protein
MLKLVIIIIDKSYTNYYLNVLFISNFLELNTKTNYLFHH